MNDNLLPLRKLATDECDAPQLCEDRNGVLFARPLVDVSSCEQDLSEVHTSDGSDGSGKTADRAGQEAGEGMIDQLANEMKAMLATAKGD